MCAESYTTVIEDDREKVYYPELDCIRGLAIILLLLLHTDVAFYLDMGFFPDGFFEQIIFSGSVPVFFFLSGLGLTLKYRSQKLELKRFYKTRYLYLIPPYLIWSFLIIAFLFVGDAVFFNPGNGSLISTLLNPLFIANILINFFFSVITGHVYTLWFVFILFLYYFFFPFLFRFFQKINSLSKILIVSAVFIFTIMLFVFDAMVFNLFFIENPSFVVYEYTSQDISFVIDLSYLLLFIPNFIYFLVGITIGFHWEMFHKFLRENISIKIIILLGALFIYFFFELSTIKVLRSIRYNLFGLSSIFLFTMLFSSISHWDKIYADNNLIPNTTPQYRLIQFLWYNGQKSTGIYFTHRIIMALVWVGLYFLLGITLWSTLGTQFPRPIALLYVSISCLLTYLGCILLIALTRKIPKNKFIIGK